jgi:hypothetical protein
VLRRLHAYGAGRPAGRPAAVDTPYGSGHVVALGYNPFYRAWKEEDEGLVLNAVLYHPKGAAIAPSSPTRAAPAPALSEVEAATPALSAKQLRAAVKAAKLTRLLRHNARCVKTKRTVTSVVKGART